MEDIIINLQQFQDANEKFEIQNNWILVFRQLRLRHLTKYLLAWSLISLMLQIVNSAHQYLLWLLRIPTELLKKHTKNQELKQTKYVYLHQSIPHCTARSLIVKVLHHIHFVITAPLTITTNVTGILGCTFTFPG